MQAALLLTCASLSADMAMRPNVVVVVGAEGTAEYGREFRQWAGRWEPRPNGFRERGRSSEPKMARSSTGCEQPNCVWFAAAASKNLPAAFRSRRDKLEQDLARLRERKGQLAEDEYLKLLEPLLVETARIYEETQ